MRTKKDLILLVLCSLILIFIHYGLKNRDIKVKNKFYNEMVLSAKNMEKLTNEIKAEKIRRGIFIDKNIDKNLTGLMGEEWSGISTTLGNEEAKRTSINPDFSALIVKNLKELKLKEGDVVVANMSSSFPALNLALISALDTLKLKGVLINSVGSSNYGGNLEEFDYLDMENHLYKKGLIKNRSEAFSFGGINDIGKEFEESTKERIKDKNQEYGLKFFYEEELNKNLEERYRYYQEKSGGKIGAFVNVGGNLLSLGRNADIVVNTKVLLNKEKNLNVKGGLVGKFLEDNKPVLYLLNIKGIALANGILIDPVPFPEIGTSQVYYEKQTNLSYNIAIVIIFLLFVGKILFVNKKFKKVENIEKTQITSVILLRKICFFIK